MRGAFYETRFNYLFKNSCFSYGTSCPCFVYLFVASELIGMVIIGAPMVIAVFAAVLQRLLQEAIDIKSENDLIV